MDTKRQRIANFYIFAERIGVDADTADKLRRIEMSLHRWAEAECNGEIQRGDDEVVSLNTLEQPCASCKVRKGRSHRSDCTGGNHTLTTIPGKPRRYYGPNMDRSYPVADREAGALKRLAKIMEGLPHLVAYHQTDPRGCALYLVPKDKLQDGHDISSVYNRGFGVCY